MDEIRVLRLSTFWALNSVEQYENSEMKTGLNLDLLDWKTQANF